MKCQQCRWFVEKHDCPWDYQYIKTDYAEDCTDFRNIDNPGDSFEEKSGRAKWIDARKVSSYFMWEWMKKRKNRRKARYYKKLSRLQRRWRKR